MLSNPLLNTNTNTNTNNMDSEYFGDGEFEFVSEWSRPYLKSAHKAVTRCKLWDWLRKYEPEEEFNFSFIDKNLFVLEYKYQLVVLSRSWAELGAHDSLTPF